MGSWYKVRLARPFPNESDLDLQEGEMGKRGAIFSSAAQVATIFSGVLQGDSALLLCSDARC
jgi:hypothetical protein